MREQSLEKLEFIGVVKANDLTKHSLLMVSFGVLSGVFTYLYQFSMSFFLSSEQYGILFSLTSLLVIIQVLSQTVTISVAKYASRLRSEGRFKNIKYLWNFSLKRVFIIGVIFLIFSIVLSPLLTQYLKLGNALYPIILFSSVVIALCLSVNWGIMQGLQKFAALGISQSLVKFLCLLIGIFFVLIGFGIYGSLAAIPIAYILAFLLTFFSMRDLSRNKNKPFKITGLGHYTSFAMIVIFSITMLTNVDVIFAKHYLNASDSGNYSALSVLGRIAFYAPCGVASALFPKTSDLFENGGNHNRVFIKALALTSIIVTGVLLIYGIAPQEIVQFLFGDKYILVAPYLFKYTLSMAFFAVTFLLMSYFLSLNRVKIAYSLVLVTLIQIILIVLFNSQISQFVNIMLISSILSILCVVPFYFFQNTKILVSI